MMGVVEIARTGMRPLLVAGSDNSVPKRRSEECGRSVGEELAAADPGRGRNDPGRPDVIFLHRRLIEAG